MIPKTIHQIWIGPQKAPLFLGSWKEKNPSFEYLLWGEIEINEIRMLNRDLYDAYDLEATNRWNGKANIARLEILIQMGGIYIDADIECLRPLEGDFLKEDFFASYVNEAMRGGRINNAVMGSTAGHPILGLMIGKLMEKERIEQPSWKFSGPGLLTECVAEFAEKSGIRVCILPSFYFQPDFFEGEPYCGDFKPFGYHHWGSTKKPYRKSYGQF